MDEQTFRDADRPGEPLLTVAERAFRTSTRGAWAHRTPHSHEARSDTGAWRTSWLHALLGTTSRAPQTYLIALRHVAVTLDADPVWCRWWRASGWTECELGIVAEGRLDHLRPSADIRQDGGRIRANFTCAPPAGTRPADLLELAAAELTGMFEVIRQAIRLPALPPLPALPAPPPDAGELEVTTRALPAVPREPQQQGYLTLTQIQEFFG